MPWPNQSPLCEFPHDVDRDTSVHCATENGSFITAPPTTTPSSLLTLAFNINYNGLGGEGDPDKQDGLEPILNFIQHLSPDFVLLTEVERGCSTYDNGAAWLAARLEMDYVYAVEFISTKNSDRDEQNNMECSTGNAVLSKHPLDNPKFTRFDDQCCWYENRASGRSAISAVAKVGTSNVVISSGHYESGNEDVWLPAVFTRGGQARQQAKDVKGLCEKYGCTAAILGGDFNSPFRSSDPVSFPLRFAGFLDAHHSTPFDERRTIEGVDVEASFKDNFGLDTLDYIYTWKARSNKAGVCHDPELCHGWSDHTSVWTETDIGGVGAITYNKAALKNIGSDPNAEPYKANWLIVGSNLLLGWEGGIYA
ncbi:hypothetical protein TL16_g11415 [Triparma laevis f. inornata]|uniref:Endonuclease/exonuclease/phosphatase domain-containing protein n=2 Tax=Triparma laevis TaxID=1534972 RepID=A0A9W6ZJU3_9STRA|nr:hypothetical protein TrLO_g2523 [Triparma laevis f. longispina]GMH89296.1 hypothetical protein TL16_g11415 [Triparma laevis f. inornata]